MKKGSGKYLYPENSKHPHEYKPCEECGEVKLIRRERRFCSKACSASYMNKHTSIKHQRGEEHHHWQGSNACYQALHARVSRVRGKADHCSNRASAECTSEKYEWAHIHGTDPSDPANYRPLCKSCHIRYDVTSYEKISIAQVPDIRNKHSRGQTYKELGMEYNVSPATIGLVVRREGRYALL